MKQERTIKKAAMWVFGNHSVCQIVSHANAYRQLQPQKNK